MNFYGNGNLTREPEIRSTQSGKSVAHFSIAENIPLKNGEKKTNYYECVQFGGWADNMRGLPKGAPLVVYGALSDDRYTDKNGTERRRTILECTAVFQCARRQERATERTETQNTAHSAEPVNKSYPKEDDNPMDRPYEDIPF